MQGVLLHSVSDGEMVTSGTKKQPPNKPILGTAIRGEFA